MLATPVHGASLAALRIAVGLVMALEAYSLCRPSAMVQGHTPLERYFTGPDIKFHLPYEGFDWLPLLPAPWIQVLIGVLALAGVAMALGFCYRASAVTAFLAWGYLFVVESTRTYWQSYYYVELLFAFLMIWTPAARRCSVDAWLVRSQDRPRTVPYWTVWLLRAQLVITYFYAGVSKLNLDWLLDAMPVRWDLAEAHAMTTYGPYLTGPQLEALKDLLQSVPFAYAIAYAGVIFDLTIGFLFLVRRTRVLAMILMVLFHAMNHFVIFDNIDWFPLVGVTTATIFLDPDWPERLWNWIRRPQIAKPDWGWLIGGAILVPAAGAALGWKLRPSNLPEVAHAAPAHLGGWVAPLLVVWLVSQALLPIRHYLIPGDGRFTYEGLSFSWRPKADDHHALSVQMSVDDPAIVARANPGRTRINWQQWHGEKVIYRRVAPGRLDWQRLPEIVVLLEPRIGERLIYNPSAGSAPLRSEAESRLRVGRIWQELYGRQPGNVRPPEPLSQVLESLSAGLSAAGLRQESAKLAGLIPRARQFDRNQLEPQEALRTCRAVREALDVLQSRDDEGAMMPYLRALSPFALEAQSQSQLPRPFLLIEDPILLDGSGRQPRRVNPAVWKTSGYSSSPRASLDVSVDGEPLVVYLGEIGGQAKYVLPQACLLDSEDHPEQAPYVWWNSLRDLSPSKLMHVSNQAFYLRRYARRVASLWETEYGRRPAVHARTAVSLNGRPYQFLVDPDVDLATVPVAWFGHNAWIKDLETPRIPRQALTQRPANRLN